MTTRKVTVHNTVGQNNQTFMSNAQTWGELRNEFDSRGIKHSGMSVVQGENQVSLESTGAQLMQGDITIFLVPQKVKSGSEEWLIDWEDGITWSDFNAEEEEISDYTYKTTRDLAVARAKKAQNYIQGVIEYLVNEGGKTPESEEVTSLTKAGKEIMENLGIFN